jgi:hypothetical protein
MGIDVNGARFLAYARQVGVDFTRVAMIGRQSLYVSPTQMREVLGSFGDPISNAEAKALCDSGGFSEALLRRLGAADPHSFDYSSYQGPTFTHDMNQPLPERFKGRYSAVLDGGSLEHIFNFAVAIRNCMEMVEVGGHYLAITPANNFFGHGFYQFSPELYFTVLSPQNGFEVTRMIAFEERSRPVWYRVANPRDVGGRVTLQNSWPVFLLIIAKRLAKAPIFEHTPQQSDYTVAWGERKAARQVELGVPRPLPIRLAKMVLPFGMRQAIRQAMPKPKPPVFDPRYFRAFDPSQDRPA